MQDVRLPSQASRVTWLPSGALRISISTSVMRRSQTQSECEVYIRKGLNSLMIGYAHCLQDILFALPDSSWSDRKLGPHGAILGAINLQVPAR